MEDKIYVVHTNKYLRNGRRTELSDLLGGPIDPAKAKGVSKLKRNKPGVYVTKEDRHKLTKNEEKNLDDLCHYLCRTVEYISVYPGNWYYRKFTIPKRDGGQRILEEPSVQLKRWQMNATDRFLKIHECRSSQAFAYVKHRNAVDALKRHTCNKSRWYLKIDLHNFFGSTDSQLVIDQMLKIHPFYNIKTDYKQKLKICIQKCFMNNEDRLPQGAPSSPLISNLIMIPFDYEFNKWCRNNKLVYTRYADDMIISGRNKFDYNEVITEIEKKLKDAGLPYTLNRKKTRFGSYKGRNFNLGLMCNGEYKITIGHRKKKELKAMLTRIATIDISNEEKRRIGGIINYYLSIEKEYVTYLINKYNKKFGVDIMHEVHTMWYSF